MKRIRNPVTGKLIFVGGPTYLRLKNDPKYSKMLSSLPIVKKSELKTKVKSKGLLKTRKIYRSKTKYLREQLDTRGIRLSQMKKMPGRGSLGKYKPDEGPFCGPSGGSGDLTFPVNTKKRAINAVVRSVNAPNPSAVRKCATSYAVKRGWITKADKERLLKKYK